MYCSNCGKQVPADAKFCSNCGHKLVSSGETIGNPMVHATSANVYQAPDEMHADFEFEVQSRNGATVSVLRKITNIRNNVIKIPAKDGQGNPVVEIASTTNRGVCDAYIEYLVIPDSVTCIGKKAFAYNHLNHITIPNSVTSIGDDAFYDCNIPELKLPDTIKSIGRTAFCASKITNINIPGSVTFCGDTILSTCSNLKNVTIGDGFKRIEDRMFYYNFSLESITLPSTLEYISANAFEQCKVQKVHFRGTQAQWKALTASSHYSTRAQWQALMKDLHFGTIVCCVDNTDANNTASATENAIKKYEPGYEPPQFKPTTVKPASSISSNGCYVATCVYGSYDCPQVWTLRRFRDDTLGATWYGRAFIRAYYAISPTLVKWFGKTTWFKKMWHGTLNKMVSYLNNKGVDDTPYQDKDWR